MLESKSLSHIGNVRERNEDSYCDNASAGSWVLADGVGGNSYGHIASEIAVQSAERALRQGDSVGDAIEAANAAIIRASKEHSEWEGMASTIVVCQFDGAAFDISWIGDSRAYVLSDTTIRLLTSDHNLAQEQGLETAGAQHQLTQALGFMTLEHAPTIQGVLDSDETLLICSDGLSGVLEDGDVHHIVKQSMSLDEAADTLLSETLAAGAPDNVTFCLIRETQKKAQGDDEMLESEAAVQEGASQDSCRACFDDQNYVSKSRYRPHLLLMMIVSLIVLFFLV